MKRVLILCVFLFLFVGCGQQGVRETQKEADTISVTSENTAVANDKHDVTLAVPVADGSLDLESSISGELYEIITMYNETSNQYQIVPVAYTSETALQLMITSCEVDIINWGESILQQSDGPNAQMYASKGYLLDLESSQLSDSIDTSIFIERIITLDKETYGGLYTLPLSFYGRTLIGKTEYVGDGSGWTLSDVISVAECLPDDIVLYSGVTQSVFLELMLDCVINDFFDTSTKTADFCNSEFYGLLELCKTKFPQEPSEEFDTAESLLYVTPLQGYVGIFGEGFLATAEEQGLCAIGYPLRDAGSGNGVNLAFVNELSICANTKNLDGAADFFAYVFSDEIQKRNTMFSPVQSIFESNEKSYVTENNACTQELSEAAMEYIYNASSIAMRSSPISKIVLEEASAFFSGDKSVEDVADIIQSRVEIYLSEQY